MTKSSSVSFVLSAALVAMVGCSSPEVSTMGGSSNGSKPGSGGSGYVLPPPGTGDPSKPADTTGGTTPSTDMNCGLRMIDLQKRPADLLLVLDRSTSMLQDATGKGPGGGGGGVAQGPQKWTEVVAALDPVIMTTQDQVAWGLKMFPLGDACGVPDGATVPVGISSYTGVMNAVRMNPPLSEPIGSTPTRVAVEKATMFMSGNPSPNAKYLVVATDGLPNCRGGSGRGDDAAGAIAAIGAAAKAGIPSFVVGIATAGSGAHATLNEMAVQGGRPRNDPTKYYPVTNKDELVTALGLITGQIASCTFPLDPLPPQPDNVRVNVDGVKVDRDTTQAGGWNYGPGNKTVVLFGAACDNLKSGAAKNVQILYGCPGRVVE